MLLAYIDPGTGYTLSSLGSWLIVLVLVFFRSILALFRNFFNFFKRRRGVKTAVILVAITAFFCAGGLIMKRHPSAFDKKIIVLGIDGLDPALIEEMMSEGRLPNFAGLKQNGSYRRLATANPPQSPVVWASIATGKKPGSTGIFDFIVRDPKDYTLSLSLSNPTGDSHPIKSKTFWEYLSDAKIETTLIQYPLTFPPYRIYGRMLSGMGVPDMLGTQGTFTFYTTDHVPSDKDRGGRVCTVSASPVMTMDLVGPRVSEIGRPAKNVTVPFSVETSDHSQTATINCQSHKLTLQKGTWSQWQEVEFRIGLFKKAKGIFKFYLADTLPSFKLYVTPMNFDPRASIFPISYPHSYSRLLAKNIGLYFTQGMPGNTWALNEGRLSEQCFLEQLDDILAQKKAMLDLELHRSKKGFLFCYLGSTDVVQHMFWRYTDPSHPLYEKDATLAQREIIRQWYKKADAVLGDVLRTTGPDDTVLVVSDHGFDTFRRAVHVNAWLRKHGYLELKDPAAPRGGELLSDIDWSKTQAYAIGFGAIYINEKGREQKGIVSPGEGSARVKAGISAGLKEWRDEKYGEPVITNVYSGEDIFSGPYKAMSPDLYIGFNRGYRASWQTAMGAVPDKLIEYNIKKWSGEHLVDPSHVPGVFFSNKKISEKNPSVLDIAPTILKAAGFSKEQIKKYQFDGSSLL